MSTPSCKTCNRKTWTAGPLALLPVAGAILLWATSLSGVDLRAMNDLGLVSVLSPWTYAALVLLTVSFCLNVSRAEERAPFLLLHLVALVLIIHATPHLLYGTLRYPWAWKHVGIVDYIQRHGSVDSYATYLGVYHNWPGFFSLNALVTEVAGFESAIRFAGWAPVFLNLIDIGALFLIVRSFTRDQRLIWLSIWFFFLANWIGQDYFSPQALTFFLYLVVMGISLNWFRVMTPPSNASIKHWLRSERVTSLFYSLVNRAKPVDTPTIQSQSFRRMGLIMIIVLILVAIASTHQLTPLMTIWSLALLVMFQVITPRSLPVLMAVLTVTWIIYMAEAFLTYNLYWILDSVGSFMGNFRANLINLADASPGQVLVAYIDRGLSVLVLIMAFCGFVRRVRRGHWDLPAVLLTISPFPLLIANSYGGEMVFRVYLFALPFLTFFAAALLYPTPESTASQRTTFLSILVSTVMLTGLLFGYYGKERQYYFTPDEIAAIEYVNATAPETSLLMDGTWGWGLQYQNYELYEYLSLAGMSRDDRLSLIADPVGFISGEMAWYPSAYLVISRSQKAMVDMTGIMPPGSLLDIEHALMESEKFKVIYGNDDALVFVLANSVGGVTQ